MCNSNKKKASIKRKYVEFLEILQFCKHITNNNLTKYDHYILINLVILKTNIA